MSVSERQKAANISRSQRARAQMAAKRPTGRKASLAAIKGGLASRKAPPVTLSDTVEDAPEAEAKPEAMPHFGDEQIKQLWCAVLGQAVEDAKAPRPEFKERDWDKLTEKENERRTRNGSAPITAKQVRRRAQTEHRSAVNQWEQDRAYIGSRSFREVCWLCGLDPEAVEWRVRRQMA